jgi:hypothetical protein
MNEQRDTVIAALRMPVPLRLRLQVQARRNHRTLTGEMLHLLELALALQGPPPTAPASSANGSDVPGAPGQ